MGSNGLRGTGQIIFSPTNGTDGDTIETAVLEANEGRLIKAREPEQLLKKFDELDREINNLVHETTKKIIVMNKTEDSPSDHRGG